MCSWKEYNSRVKSKVEISSLLNQTVLEKRRYYMVEVVSTILFLAKNELPFRGNWEKSNNDETGLFRNLFKYTLQKDEQLRKCQEAMPQNAKYTSPDIQNKMISILSNYLRQEIVAEMNKSPYLTLMADGASDRQGDEILSIAFRYTVDGKAKETLLCFEKADDRTAMGFFQLIINQMEKWGINGNSLLSQCYDGAAVNSGRLAGLQVQIQTHFKRTIPYVHCISHRLHLVVVEIIKNLDECRLFFDEVKVFHDFFSHHNVRALYEGTNIPLLIEQRWSGHYKAVTS